MGLVLVWLLCAVIAALVANSRGGSAIGGFAFGALLGPFGIAIAFFLGSAQDREARSLRSGQLRKCPRCAELVRAEALVCKHCHAELPAPAPMPLPAPAVPLTPEERAARNKALLPHWIAGAALLVTVFTIAHFARPEPAPRPPLMASTERCAAANERIMRLRADSGGEITNPESGVIETPLHLWQALPAADISSVLTSLGVQNACALGVPIGRGQAVVREPNNGRAIVEFGRTVLPYSDS